MKRLILLIIVITAVITAALFFINFKEKNILFFYNLFFTILFESLFIIWFGISADYKNMNINLKIIFFVFIIVSAAVQFITLFFGTKILKINPISNTLTTMLLIEAGAEIIISFIIFATGNLFSKK